ncbi:hypothetical protein D8674_011649 [Pyrus ussuriensis x Pyrus communis]|uniref:Reverse transcriptase/retrotransposon-derived protein RNase H-like domain-containing protein n=1 Tax=Pyrus ussuriensis x Pyrus communis TaxID=2448454 RepID=A0A5N5G3Z4_9ROSA|nr:hypothetical protein D8674_011649 [Pyrus ussuriensis x Pyrus communis]
MKAFSTVLKLKDSDKFEWREEHQTAFTQIKVSPTTPPVLVPPRYGKPLKLYISATDKSIGCFIVQDNYVGREQAIFYLSRNLNPPEINYSPVKKLCLALFFVATKLRHYMLPSVTQLDFSCMNNLAEYEAFIIGLHVLHDLRAARVLVLSDSELTRHCKINKEKGSENVKVFILWMEWRFCRCLRLDQGSFPAIDCGRMLFNSRLNHGGRIGRMKVDCEVEDEGVVIENVLVQLLNIFF